MDDFQFYPTPFPLARRAWKKFKDRDFSKVLEPSAGDGAMIKASPDMGYHHKVRVDCIEIDMSKHDALREAGGTVVGIDFMKFRGGAPYSHVLMNPPFAEGVHHVLHAWEIVEDAEIVAILNAETIRNAFSKERQLLVKLIEEHGEVEFIADAFLAPEASRKTAVEIALVWLRKESQIESEIIGTVLDGLKRDPSGKDLGYEEMQSLALSSSFVENSVVAFNAAVSAAKQAAIAEARAGYYAGWLGDTYEVLHGDKGSDSGQERLKSSKNAVHKDFNSRYENLKNRAWTRILASTEVTDRLSSTGQKRLEKEFELIKSLEFSVSNIYGFLLGLVQNQGDLQIEMACAVFDEISRYHTEGNTVFYMGWKSNDKHRRLARRIRMTRFITPYHSGEKCHRSADWDTAQQLGDFDKVFALLDGKRMPEYPLLQAFNEHFDELKAGARVKSSYFDIRWFPGVGTIHFFPTNQTLVDRLNRLVGRYRSWLPPEGERVSDAFWLQYEKAEKFDKQFWTEVGKAKRATGYRAYRDPVWTAMHGDERERDQAEKVLSDALTATLVANGIDPDRLLEAPEDNVLRLPSPEEQAPAPAGQLSLLAA